MLFLLISLQLPVDKMNLELNPFSLNSTFSISNYNSWQQLCKIKEQTNRQMFQKVDFCQTYEI